MEKIIVNKDRTDAYNISHITNMYIGSDGCSLKVVAGSTTRGGILGKYHSCEETKTAFEILLDEIAKSDAKVLYLSDEDKVHNKLKMRSQTACHTSGRKIKGHGGS